MEDWRVDELVDEKAEKKPRPVVAKEEPEPFELKEEPKPFELTEELKPVAPKEEPEPIELKEEPEPIEREEEPESFKREEEPKPVAAKVEPKPVWRREEPKPVAHKEGLKPVWRKEEPKPVAAKVEPKPVTAKVEPKPVTAKVEPKPVTAKVEPKPVTAKIEPKPVARWEEPKPFELTEEPKPVAPKEEAKPTAKPISISPDKVQFRWKIVVCGPGGVGKSTMLHRYFYREFLPDMIMTIGVSHMSHIIERQGKIINLIIWDLSGQKRFEVLHPAYVGDSTGAMVVFDMSQSDTLEEVNHWVEMIRKYNPNNRGLPIIIVGTKIDLVTDQAFLDKIYKRIEEKMAELDLQYVCVTSSKTNYNIDETMTFLIDYLLFQQNLI